MKPSTLLIAILVLAFAGLGFGQVVRRTLPTGAKPADDANAQSKIKPGTFKGIPINLPDSMQCIMGKSNELAAAYAEADNSGCKKVKSGQWSEYRCGYDTDPQCGKCRSAEQKIGSILQGCRLKAPQHTPPQGPDGIAMDTPGCNSLGIQCLCEPMLY